MYTFVYKVHHVFSQELDSMKRIFDESEKQIGLQNLKLNMTENVLPGKNQYM